ncbi:MAG TPA: hypothetical protein VG839_10125, partial [Asticcacaulis sp.]|nr:hypothetical protein [Asticcacaulis sp.]
GAMETFARVTWSYGQPTMIPPETYVVDAYGRLYYVGASEPIYSPSHNRMITHSEPVNDELSILDWAGTDNGPEGFTFGSLMTIDGWTDESHIRAKELPNEGLITSVISRRDDGAWQVQELEFYDGLSEAKPGAVPKKLNQPPEVVARYPRNSTEDMLRMEPHGYIYSLYNDYSPPSSSAASS